MAINATRGRRGASLPGPRLSTVPVGGGEAFGSVTTILAEAVLPVPPSVEVMADVVSCLVPAVVPRDDCVRWTRVPTHRHYDSIVTGATTDAQTTAAGAPRAAR